MNPVIVYLAGVAGFLLYAAWSLIFDREHLVARFDETLKDTVIPTTFPIMVTGLMLTAVLWPIELILKAVRKATS